MIPIEIILLIFLIIAAIAVCVTRHLLGSVILFTSYSIIISVLWILLRAPDLGITEAAVGTGISNMLFFVVLKRIRVMEEEYADLGAPVVRKASAALTGNESMLLTGDTVAAPSVNGADSATPDALNGSAATNGAAAMSGHAAIDRSGILPGLSMQQRANRKRAFSRTYAVFSVIFGVFLFLVLIVMNGFLPRFGEPGNPAHNEVSKRYIEQGVSETGAVNVVAGLILDYRGFDTFGESCVLFVAVCAVLALLRKEERDAFDELLHAMEETTHDVILKQVSHIMVPLIALFGVYVVVGGHLGPGGGFSGGAILGSAMILFACSFGTIEARRVFSYDNCRKIMTAALLFYAALKGFAMYAGANGIETGISVGVPGRIFSAGLLVPLNIAVGIIVACTMYILYILFSKGEML